MKKYLEIAVEVILVVFALWIGISAVHINDKELSRANAFYTIVEWAEAQPDEYVR